MGFLHRVCGVCVALNATVAALLVFHATSTPWPVSPEIHVVLAVWLLCLGSVNRPKKEISLMRTPEVAAIACLLAFLAAAPRGGPGRSATEALSRGALGMSAAWYLLAWLGVPTLDFVAAHGLAAIAAFVIVYTAAGVALVRKARALAETFVPEEVLEKPKSWWAA